MHLTGVYPTGAHLTGVPLTGVYLTGAPLTGAYLTGLLSVINVHFLGVLGVTGGQLLGPTVRRIDAIRC